MPHSLKKGHVLTPKMVLEQELLPGVRLTWIYDNWDKIGGVTIGNKKFILMEKLYACLSRNEQDVENEDQRTHQRVQEIPASIIRRDAADQLEYKERSQSRRTGAGKTSEGDVLTDHTNDFGFANLV